MGLLRREGTDAEVVDRVGTAEKDQYRKNANFSGSW
jgi:hypothetical protein